LLRADDAPTIIRGSADGGAAFQRAPERVFGPVFLFSQRRMRGLPMLGCKTTADYGMGLAPIFFSRFSAREFADSNGDGFI
jgi:hypothetical protein